jgi:hypothetical protein
MRRDGRTDRHDEANNKATNSKNTTCLLCVNFEAITIHDVSQLTSTLVTIRKYSARQKRLCEKVGLATFIL